MRFPDGIPEYEGVTIQLITPEEFAKLPDGTKVVSIHGEEKIKGTDEVDQDIRFGYLAWGFPKNG